MKFERVGQYYRATVFINGFQHQFMRPDFKSAMRAAVEAVTQAKAI